MAQKEEYLKYFKSEEGSKIENIFKKNGSFFLKFVRRC